jgi:hypothetical protein
MSDHRQDLALAILRLETLISNEVIKESDYQNTFEECPIILKTLGYNKQIALAKKTGKSLRKDPSTGLSPEPDFLTQNNRGLWEIVELKTPTEQSPIIDSNKYRVRFNARINDYISQVTTYAEYFSNDPRNREHFKQDFNENIQAHVDSTIIVGNGENYDSDAIHNRCRKLTPKIDILTYDQVIAILEKSYQDHYGIYEDAAGYALYANVSFNRLPQKRDYFFDAGESLTKNRLSIYLESKNGLVCEAWNAEGENFSIRSTIPPENLLRQSMVIHFDIVKVDTAIHFRMTINGERVGNIDMNNTQGLGPIKKYQIGTDLHRKNFGALDFFHLSIHPKTLNFRDHIKLISDISH